MYRIVDLRTQETVAIASRKVDAEAWLLSPPDNKFYKIIVDTLTK